MSALPTQPLPVGDLDDAAPLASLLQQSESTARELENFDRAFGLVAFTMNRYIVDHMLRFGRQFGPDYQMLLVWGVVAHQSVIAHVPAGSRPREMLNAQGLLAKTDPVLRPVRQRDLSQITGIPKETVRRKLLKLEQAGWIVRQAPGWVLNLDNLDPTLREFSRESAKRLLIVADHMRTLLRDEG